MGSIWDAIANLVKEVLGPLFSIFDDTSLEDEVEKVREITVGLCGFLPTVESVTQMLQASNPIVSGVMAIARAICQAVSDEKPGVMLAIHKPRPTVNGVNVEGDWVQK